MLTPGTLLGERYEIIEKIGAGGMSIVYKAKDNRLQRYVAIKELREEFVQDEAFVGKFRKEALSAASLSHPNIVGIYDVGSDHDVHYIVMEYVEGKTLKQLIEEEGPFDAKTVIELGIQIVCALKHAHSKKIIHRDIKPQNILMTHDGTLKVTDFGIAKAVDSSTIVATGNAIGSVHYFSPEQAKGKYVNESSDLYSCGIVLFEMATKKLPFEADSHISIALKHINEELPMPSAINPAIPQNLENLILKATSKNQIDRYQNADEMLRDMKGILHDPDYEVKNQEIGEKTILLSAEETQILRDSGKEMHKNGIKDKTEEEPINIYDRDIHFEEEDDEDEVPTINKVIFSIAGVLATLTVVVAVSLACVFWLPSLHKTYSVPNVMEKTLEQAQKMIKDNQLQYNVIQQVDDSITPGTVINQDPTAGTPLKKGGVVHITVAVASEEQGETDVLQEEVSVPDLEGLDTSNAQEAIMASGLAIGDVDFAYDEVIAAGTVLRQEPLSGTKVQPGSSIHLTISKGPEKPPGVLMPTVVGSDLETAKTRIIQAHLKVGEVSEEYSDDYEAGTVIRQGINEGTLVEEGTFVDLTVSKGKEESTPEPEPSESPEEEPTPEPTPDEEQQQPEEPVVVTQEKVIALPPGTEVKDSYHLVAKLTLSTGESQVICDETIAYDHFPKTIELTGSGTGILYISIDGQGYQENISF